MPSVNAEKMPYLFKHDAEPSKAQGDKQRLHLYWNRPHLAANLFAHMPEQKRCAHSMNAGCKKESCTNVQHQLYPKNQCLHTTTAKVGLTRKTVVARSSRIAVTVCVA